MLDLVHLHGIRIGVASVKAIAEVWNIPIAAVTSLETLARNCSDERKKVALIDARNDQVYCGIFDEKFDKLEDFFADDINVAIEKISKYNNLEFVGDGAEKHFDLINNTFSDCALSLINEQYARNLGKMAYKKYIENDLKNADTVMPIYLRNKM